MHMFESDRSNLLMRDGPSFGSAATMQPIRKFRDFTNSMASFGVACLARSFITLYNN